MSDFDDFSVELDETIFKRVEYIGHHTRLPLVMEEGVLYSFMAPEGWVPPEPPDEPSIISGD